ncbi:MULTISPECIES: hypothetical protein [unclassified Variovorax]|uniref:hypothetical protein n=1 Tax=unclassified Variovorax TaxID=663243 RepID=UPI001315E614|nr:MULTISPECIES: hypothetical protein [unclassified Variovorax]VTU42912.1 hypothetical protein H6P1_00310 [Variovorax sp. PBL-H6]VTU43591.1 hypothetical protein SRS16P1_00595 [Variovorax sp. SRS16]VTU43653.1 hypothetical protein E5P1_00589 [Variovorax sp. PBL-E5]
MSGKPVGAKWSGSKLTVITERTSAWRPMAKAPKDGTVILVCETPNGEAWNVMPAAFMNLYGGGRLAWWGVSPTSRLPTHLMTPERMESADEHSPLAVDWRPIALTPICWQPMPELEDVSTLRRRFSAIAAHKYKDLVRAAGAVPSAT